MSTIKPNLWADLDNFLMGAGMSQIFFLHPTGVRINQVRKPLGKQLRFMQKAPAVQRVRLVYIIYSVYCARGQDGQRSAEESEKESDDQFHSTQQEIQTTANQEDCNSNVSKSTSDVYK